MQLINVAIAISIEVDIGGNVERHHERLFWDRELRSDGSGWSGRQHNFRGKIVLVAFKIIVTVDQYRGVEGRFLS